MKGRIFKIENGRIKPKKEAKEQSNPNKKNIDKEKTEYAKLKNDSEKINFLAKQMGLL